MFAHVKILLADNVQFHILTLLELYVNLSSLYDPSHLNFITLKR